MYLRYFLFGSLFLGCNQLFKREELKSFACGLGKLLCVISDNKLSKIRNFNCFISLNLVRRRKCRRRFNEVCGILVYSVLFYFMSVCLYTQESTTTRIRLVRKFSKSFCLILWLRWSQTNLTRNWITDDKNYCDETYVDLLDGGVLFWHRTLQKNEMDVCCRRRMVEFNKNSNLENLY